MKRIITVMMSLGIVAILLGAYLTDSRNVSNESDYVVTQVSSAADDVFSEDEIFLKSNKEDEIVVFVKGSKEESKRYIGYKFQHVSEDLDVNKKNSNYDLWKLNGAGEYRRTKSDSFIFKQEVVRTGEWEMALQEKGAGDFVGGSAHGDEITTSVKLYVDGKEVTLQDFEDTKAVEFKIVTDSDLYRDSQMTENLESLGKHSREYTFNGDGLSLYQTVTFDISTVFYRPYLTMLPILRDKNGGQVTDSYTVNDDEFDVTTDQFEMNRQESEKATISGKESGIVATVEITEKNVNAPTVFHVSNSPDYNKMYFAFAPDDYPVSAGEGWEQTTIYDIDTLN